MDRTLNVQSAANVQKNARLVGFPDECPQCHTKLVPKVLAHVACAATEGRDLEEAYQCTNNSCERIFVGSFKYQPDGRMPPAHKLYKTAPLKARTPEVGDLVRQLSPVFFEVYSQALVAESLQLTQLTGIGLRKALEFLVKDFAVSKLPDQKEKIRHSLLAVCIKDYIDDSNVKATAKRAAWLGNDETHYIRKWDDKDINDLKLLIRLTVNGVENALLASKYVAEMPDPKP